MALLVVQEREPVDHGKCLSVWLRDCDKSEWVGSERQIGQKAVQQIGTNAIPWLLRGLREIESPLVLKFLGLARRQKFVRIQHTPSAAYNHKAAVGFEALGQTAKDAVPALIQTFQRNLSIDSQRETAISLGWIGPAAKDAIPTLIEASTNATCPARAEAVWALTRIGDEANRLVPALTTCLGDSSFGIHRHALAGLYGSVRGNVLLALADYGTNASAAVPAVVSLLADPDGQVRQAATNALRAIDPGAAARAGVKQ
jgi:HEAT repeat protein